jgi:PKD repeat protein
MAFRTRTWQILATLVVAVFASAPATAGAVRVDLLSTARDAAPGDVVTHVFAVSHDEPSGQTLSLAYDVPPSWTLLGAPPEIAVAAGDEGVVFLTLTVPSDAAAGSYVLTLRAASQTDPTDEASAGVTTRVAVVNQVELVPPAGKSVAPGGSVSYDVLVVNRGNAQDVLALAVVSSRAYAASPSTASLELSPRETQVVTVVLAVPADAGPGRDVITVRASSTLYAEVEDEIAVFTTILPPGPNAVGGSLLEILPLRVHVGVERDETAGTFDSQISLATSGPVFDGTFSASATALHPFGSDPVNVTAYSLLYRLDAASYAVGKVSQSLTDLVSVSCDGGSIAIDGAMVDVSLIAGGGDEETRFGGLLALGPEEAQVGLAYSDRRSQAARWATWTGTAQAEPLDGWTLRGEGGLGTDNGRLGRAGFVGTTIDSDAYFLSAGAFSVDTYFPGPRNDTAGIEVSQRLRLTSLSLGLSMRHAWDNVVRDPLAPTLVSDSLGLNLSATPWDDGPTVQTTLELGRRNQADGTPRDEVNALLAYSVTETEGAFPYAFTGRIADHVDRLMGTSQRTLTHTQKVGLSADEFSILLTLSEERVVDLVHDLVLSSAASASLTVRPQGARHEAVIEFRSLGDEFDLDASLVVHATDDVDATFDGFARWERGNPAGARFGWSVGIHATFGVPFPFLVTKGRIEGRAFVDRNVNGVLDEGEPPAEGVIVFVEESEVSTDASGKFRFPPLSPDLYHLSARELPLDTSFGSPIEIQLGVGERQVIDVPLAPILTIRGAVFDDANQDGTRQPQEAGLAGIRVHVQRGGVEVAATTTDARGEFAWANARPGIYVVSLDASTLPERFSFTTPESQAVDVSAEPPILFGGFIRPREVIVTFQPPTADGVATPAAPRVGEVVTFDASLSFDFDGEIVSYAWDVDGDGHTDSTDAVTTYVFVAAGRYQASLTVTDNAGNSDTQVLEIDVTEVPRAAIAPSTAGSALRPPVADFAYAPVSPVAGQRVTFDAAASVDFDGSIVRYAWDFDDDGNPDAEGVAVEWTFSAPGSYDVAVTVTDEAGMSDTVAYAVEVKAVPQILPAAPSAPSARFVYAPPSPRAGDAVRFDASSSVDPIGGALDYAWDFDANGTRDGDGPISEWTFSTPGTYPVTLTVVAAGGLSNSVTQQIPVLGSGALEAGGSEQPPIAALQYVPPNPSVNEPVLFNATASIDLDGLVVAYAWDFDGDGTPDSTDAIAVHAFSQPGAVSVTLTVVDDAGNSDSISVEIEIK